MNICIWTHRERERVKVLFGELIFGVKIYWMIEKNPIVCVYVYIYIHTYSSYQNQRQQEPHRHKLWAWQNDIHQHDNRHVSKERQRDDLATKEPPDEKQQYLHMKLYYKWQAENIIYNTHRNCRFMVSPSSFINKINNEMMHK